MVDIREHDIAHAGTYNRANRHAGRTSRANHHFRTHGRANHIHFRTHEPCVPTEKYSLTAKERNLIDTHM